MPQQTTYWLAVEVLTLLVLAAGLVAHLAFWLQGSAPAGRRPTARRPIGRVLDGARSLLRPGSLGRLLADAVCQWRLFRASRWRWLAHAGLFWGNVVLFFVGSLGLMLAERGLLPLTKDTPWFAAVNEVAGLLVLFGVAVGLCRRLGPRPNALALRSATSRQDVVLLVSLGLVVVSGYGLESGRLATQQVPPAIGWYSFVGYAFMRALAVLSPDWSGLYQGIWWFHALSAMALVASIPYGKLFHIVASPLAMAARLAHFGRPFLSGRSGQ